jgi:hypothetical protein
MPGSSQDADRGPTTYEDRGSDQRLSPRGAGAVAVERGELAPLPEIPQGPDSRRESETPPSASWDVRTAPGRAQDPAPSGGYAPPPPGYAPYESRERGLPHSGYAPYEPRDRGPAPRALPPPGPRSDWEASTRARPVDAAPRARFDDLAGIDAKALEDITSSLTLPSRSPTIAALWPRVWTDAGRGGQLSPAFEGIRIETLAKSGDLIALKDVLDRTTSPSDPVMAIVVMRARLLIGDRDAGCALAGEAIRNRAKLPASFRRDAVLAAGYCAMVGGNAEAAKLTVDLIRGERLDVPFALAVLSGAGAGGKAPPPLPAHIGALDYRIGEIAGIVWPKEVVERADAGVLAVIATTQSVDPGLRVVAAERAARLNMLTTESLAEQYRGIPHAPDEMAHPLATRLDGAMRRSLLMQAAEAERAPDKRARLMRALMEEASRAGVGPAVARILGPLVEQMRPSPEIGWFAETAVESLVQSGRGEAATAWIEMTRGQAEHWRILATLASGSFNSARGLGLDGLEGMARSGRFEAPTLHRLVTVLDALDIQVPIPLWEAASRTQQPTDGYLPPTGVLHELKAAQQKGGATTVLRVAQAIGPSSAAEANLLTLGDAIRALKGAGLDREARTLGVEAIIASWPRGPAR